MPPGERGSYRKLLSLPAWGLYDGDRIVASVSAGSAAEARALFLAHNERNPEWELKGNRVKRIGGKA